jgi:hypothetical protein
VFQGPANAAAAPYLPIIAAPGIVSQLGPEWSNCLMNGFIDPPTVLPLVTVTGLKPPTLVEMQVRQSSLMPLEDDSRNSKSIVLGDEPKPGQPEGPAQNHWNSGQPAHPGSRNTIGPQPTKVPSQGGSEVASKTGYGMGSSNQGDNEADSADPSRSSKDRTKESIYTHPKGSYYPKLVADEHHLGSGLGNDMESDISDTPSGSRVWVGGKPASYLGGKSNPKTIVNGDSFDSEDEGSEQSRLTGSSGRAATPKTSQSGKTFHSDASIVQVFQNKRLVLLVVGLSLTLLGS